MCNQVVELYGDTRELYYQHAVDRCALYGRPGHRIEKRTILVGFGQGPDSVPAQHAPRTPGAFIRQYSHRASELAP